MQFDVREPIEDEPVLVWRNPLDGRLATPEPSFEFGSAASLLSKCFLSLLAQLRSVAFGEKCKGIRPIYCSCLTSTTYGRRFPEGTSTTSPSSDRESQLRRSRWQRSNHVSSNRLEKLNREPTGACTMTERLTINRQFHVATKRSGTKQIESGAKPVIPAGRVPRISRLLALAHHCSGWFSQEPSSTNPN